MNDHDFESELQFAASMLEKPQDLLYWTGYRRGLLRARFGQRFSSNMNHFAWRGFQEDSDPVLAELGRGYLDGLNTVITGKPSAPGHRQSGNSSEPAVAIDDDRNDKGGLS